MGGQKGKKAKTDSLPSIDFSPSPSYWVHLPGFRPANPHPRSNRGEGRQKRLKTRARSFTPFQRVAQCRMNPLSFFSPSPSLTLPPFMNWERPSWCPRGRWRGNPFTFWIFRYFCESPFLCSVLPIFAQTRLLHARVRLKLVT